MKQQWIRRIINYNKVIVKCLIVLSIIAFSQPSFSQDIKPSGKVWGYVEGNTFYRVDDSLRMNETKLEPPKEVKEEKKEEFKASGKVYGLAFMDFFYKAAGEDSTSWAAGHSWKSKSEYSGINKNAFGFALRRVYFGFDYSISPKFSTSVLLEGNDLVTTSSGERAVFVKAINLRWKNIYKRGDLVIGHQPTPTFMNSEKVWNYRSIEKTIGDMRGLRTTNDLGIGLQGTIDSSGNFGYNFLVGNGIGTKPKDFAKAGQQIATYMEWYAYFFKKKLLIDVYADYYSPKIHDKAPKTKNDITSSTTIKGFIAYQSDPFTTGIEVISQFQLKVKSDTTNANPFGISVWARGRLVKDKLNAFARYDFYNPDLNYRDKDVLTTFNADKMLNHYSEMFFTAGLDYTPHKMVHIVPNIHLNTYKENKMDDPIIVNRKMDIVPRLTMYFVFK